MGSIRQVLYISKAAGTFTEADLQALVKTASRTLPHG